MAGGRVIEPDMELIRDIKKAGGADLKKCYQCATCSAVCELSPEQDPFPRKEMLLAQWGQTEKLAQDPNVWLCYQCNDCSTHCPRGARPGDVLAAIRSRIYQHYSFPRFMGRALATPRALPFLFAFPMIVILAMMLYFTGGNFTFMQHEIVFSEFLPHGWIEGLFITGNLLIFAFAFVGLWRFWQGLQSSVEPDTGPGFISAVSGTIVAIIAHRDFAKCTANKPRYFAHMLVLFGFVGAIATAGLALIAMVAFNLDPPIPLTHPIKWLGNISAAAGIIGLGILIVRRLANRDQVGANGYSDWLFLVMLFLVFVTGWSTQFLRLAETNYLAYGIYYIHLVFVFFLLWYMPYSKFAHMLYRTMALVHARATGRIA